MLAVSKRFEPEDAAVCARLVPAGPDLMIRAAALRALLSQRVPDAPALAMSLLTDPELLDDEDALVIARDCPAEDLAPVVLHAFSTAPPEAGRAVFGALFPTQRAAELSHSGMGKQVLRIAPAQPDWQTRAHAMNLLGAAKARWARAILHEGCDDAEARVRVRAIKALAQCGFRSGEDTSRVKRYLTDAAGWVRAAAIEMLGGIDSLDDAALVAALRDEFPPAALASAHVALAMAAQHAQALSEPVRLELARFSETEAARQDPAVAQWRLAASGA